MLKRSNVLFYLIIVTLGIIPLYIVRCKYFSWCVSPIPFTLLEVFILSTIFLWLFHKLRSERSAKKSLKNLFEKIPLTLKIFTGVFLLASLAAVFVAPDKTAALGIYKAYFVEPVLLAIVLYDFLEESKKFRLILWAFMAPGLWLSVISIFEKLLGQSPFNQAEFIERGRVSSIYTSSNSVGLFVGPLILITIGYFLFLFHQSEEDLITTFKSSLEIKLVSLALLTLMAGQIVSGSRGAYLGLFAAFTFFLGFIIYKQLKEKLQKKISRIFLISTIIFFLFNFIFLFNMSSIIKLNNSSKIILELNPRLCLWEGADRIIANNPLFGAGLHGFKYVNKDFKTCSTENALYPHNIFLNFWVETGIFGLISFIGICAYIFKRLLNTEKIDFLRLGFAVSLISILFHGLLDHPYFNNDLATQFWLIIALGLYLINQESFYKVRKVFVKAPR